jgi:hypothetical protein
MKNGRAAAYAPAPSLSLAYVGSFKVSQPCSIKLFALGSLAHPVSNKADMTRRNNALFKAYIL